MRRHPWQCPVFFFGPFYKRVARGAFSLTLTCRTILPLSFGGDFQCIHVITSWRSRALCFVFQKKFIITFTSSVNFQLFFFFLTSFICCLLIRMIASQASCFVFQKKKKVLFIAFTSIVLFQSPFFSNFFRVC